MSAILLGRYSWESTRDDNGNREYHLVNRVKVTDPWDDGPATVMQCPGLPQIGDIWSYGNDVDVWAYCWPTMKVSMYKKGEGEPHSQYLVEQRFSTRQPPGRRCQDTPIEDPLLEPDKVSGSFVKYMQEGIFDKDGEVIRTTSFEPIRGAHNEWDANRPTVKIGQNVPNLELNIFSQMVDTVNDAVLWGMNPRCVKLSNVTWERNVLGSCGFYYTRTFDFDIHWDSFDRYVLNEGTKVLNGHWDPDTKVWTLDNINGSPPVVDNPSHYIRMTDLAGHPIRAILTSAGVPITGAGTSPDITIFIQKYTESNFLDLGIPTSF